MKRFFALLLVLVACSVSATIALADTIVLPDDLTRIESEAFAGIQAESVEFPATIQFIADDAFDGASFVGTGEPDTYAQNWCIEHGFEYVVATSPIEDFEWETINGIEAKITNYIGKETKVYIPSIIEGKTVVEIGEYAFSENSEVERVFLPAALETIGEYAFSECTSLTRIDLPDTVTVIDNFAFYRCSNLELVNLSANLDSINTSAFQECVSLIRIDLPESLTYLGHRAFRECTSLSHFGYPINILEVGGVFLYGCTSLKEVTVPEGVYELMDYFIANAGSVETVNLPSTLEKIGKYSFAYDNSFTTIDLPDSVEVIDEFAFYQCSNLQIIELSSNLDRIEESAFQECTALQRIDLPDSLTYLGWRSFRDCTSLTYFGYPLNIQEVGGAFLSGCTSLTEVTVPEGVTRLMDYFIAYAGSVTKINLPSTLTEIGKYSFAFENTFYTISLPEGVQIIGESAFEGNTAISSITLPSTIKEIGTKAFVDCNNLKTISFNSGLDEIGILAFANCASLTSIQLPDSVTTVGSGAFQNCTGLKTFISSLKWEYVIVPGVYNELAYEIGPGKIFDGCTRLTSVSIPEGATTVPYMAFSYVPNLSSVTLPSTIKKISNGAFMYASSLRTINFPDGITEIGYGAFKGCSSLREAALPDSVTTIGSEAFCDCTALSSFHFPKNWTTVSIPSLSDTWNFVLFSRGNVLGNNSKITSIEIPDGAEIIPEYAFQNCLGLQDVSIPNSVNKIEDSAFENCSDIRELYISTNVTSIGETSFDGCTSLTIWCEYNSVAFQHAIDHSIPYYYLSPDGINSPSGTLYMGDSYGLHGYARASVPLTEVTATIWNSDKSSAIQTITVNPDVTDYSLTDEINYHLIFATLPLGTYHYTLHASTELSEETWADTTFKIVPQPLRIYISNLSLPYGLDASDYSIAGTVVSNYPITQIKVTVYRPDSDDIVKNVTATPNAGTFNLASLNEQLALSSLANETLSIKIVATSNGETRTLKDTDLTLRTSANIVLDERKNQTLIDFASDSANRSIFTTEYIDEVIDDMSWVEDGIMFIDNVLSVSIFERLENQLIHNGNRQDLIELYKKEIVQLIEDGSYERFNIADTASKYSKDLLSILKSEGKLTKEAFKDFKNVKMENFIGSANKLIGAVQDGISTAKDLEEAYEVIATICGNYEAGLYVLEYIGSSASIASQDEFNDAMNILRTEYVSSKAAIIYEHLKIIQDLILEYGEDQIKDVLTKLLSDNFGLNFSVAMPKLFAKLTMKATGLDDVASTYKKLFVRQDLLIIANNSYKEAFDRVHNGDHSDDALLKLATAISITKSAWVRANDLITELPRYAYTVGNEYLDYRYNGRISILLTSSDFD